MIINEILNQKIQRTPEETNSNEFFIPSKKLINEILNYELSRHLAKIDSIVRTIREIDDDRGYLNQEDLEKVIVRLNIPEDKI